MMWFLDVLMSIFSNLHKVWEMIPSDKQQEIKAQIIDWFEVALRSFFRNGDSTAEGFENV